MLWMTTKGILKLLRNMEWIGTFCIDTNKGCYQSHDKRSFHIMIRLWNAIMGNVTCSVARHKYVCHRWHRRELFRFSFHGRENQGRVNVLAFWFTRASQISFHEHRSLIFHGHQAAPQLDFHKCPSFISHLHCSLIFSREHATLHLAVSVARLYFWTPNGFRITAPVQPSATGLPCIRPCYMITQYLH